MGGQSAAVDSLQLDMRAMNRPVAFDASQRTIRVQAGMTWRDLQDLIDPHDLSVRIMQSYSNFTVGGSVSVNCHGRYVGRGPLIHSVRALQFVTADGNVLELTRARESELFGAAFGGYGGLGVVTEVELDLDTNSRIERVVQDVSLDEYPAYFLNSVLANPKMLLHSAMLSPPDFDAPRAINWIGTQQPLTQPERLIPRAVDYSRDQNVLWAMTELPGGSLLGKHVVGPMLLDKKAVVWRNHEASLDVASLEPRTRMLSTYLLQEYFVPVENFVPFARAMARILNSRSTNVLNVSVRHSPADSGSLLKWAPADVFAFVLYYKQRTSAPASAEVATWTRELIDAALMQGGRYYLPYRLDATKEQFERAYPDVHAFAAQKRRVDPLQRFRNLLWDKYLPRQ